MGAKYMHYLQSCQDQGATPRSDGRRVGLRKSVDLSGEVAMMESSKASSQFIIAETEAFLIDAEESYGLDGAL
jgi:hypothetical protein